MSLKDKIPAILTHVRYCYENNIIFNQKILEVFDGQLHKHVEDIMRQEMSEKSYIKCRSRVPDINIIVQYVDKVNRTYTKPAIRSVINGNDIDKELLSKAEKELKVDQKMKELGDLLTIHRNSAIELALEDGEEVMRVIPATKFLVYSDNKNDPSKATAFIKFMGTRTKITQQEVDDQGNLLKTAQQRVREVSVFYLYDKETFIECDSEGQVFQELPNEFGCIPFIYARTKDSTLIPTPDSGLLAQGLLVPRMYADVNYAQQFQSHSIMYGINISNMNKLEVAPDVMWDLKSDDMGDQKNQPMVGTISPTVDSDKVDANVLSQMKQWLESRSIKVNSATGSDNGSSGVAKIIDQSDASSLRDAKIRLMSTIEHEFWELYIHMKSIWAKQGLLIEDPRPFSSEVEISTQFAEQKPVQDFKGTLDELKIMFDLGITTIKLALQKLYPELDETAISEMITEIEAAKAKSVAEAQSNLNAQQNQIVSKNLGVDDPQNQSVDQVASEKKDNGME